MNAIRLGLTPPHPRPKWMMVAFYVPLDLRLGLITQRITVPIRLEVAR